ncbi:GNAT family N-acetyltransferase [[Clostridium] dakarense]|uniref:GNAT family N-acetyltransferase n=1 Tax=Faecalimicrobium dakarense TaxID=1301100 RepID=UPI0004ACCAB6|nr:GNAT family N-acetyltransferase [[Clostridium] dakarense]
MKDSVIPMSSLFDEFKEIDTKKYIIRKICLNDSKDIFDIYGDIEVMKYDTRNRIESIDDTEDYIKLIHKGFDNKWFIKLGIVSKNSNELIGSIALHHFDYEKNRVEMGYNLKRVYWKQGIMSEVLKSVIDYLAKYSSINEIEASIHSENIASIKLAEKVGFKLIEKSNDDSLILRIRLKHFN